MKPEEMVALYDYNAWADRRVLEAASTLSKEEFLKPMGSSFSSIRDTLAHIFGVEWLWLERFQGRSPASIPDGNEFTELNILKARWMEFEPTLLKFVRGLTESDLDRVILEYARLTGNCCFCHYRLSDARSVAHGYGPDCAERYELPWCAPRHTHGFFGNVWNSIYAGAEAP